MAGAPVFQDLEAVIGLTGLKAAGKDELCKVLAPSGFVSRRCSDEIRDELMLRGNPNPTVFEMVEMGNLGRAESGDIGYWARRVVATLAGRGCRRIIVNGLRHPVEVDALQDIAGTGLTMVGIVAPTPVRAKRLIDRGRPGDPTTYEEFMRLDDTDRGIGQPPHGQQVDRTLARVPWENLYDNKGTLDEYRAWIAALAARALPVTA